MHTASEVWVICEGPTKICEARACGRGSDDCRDAENKSDQASHRPLLWCCTVLPTVPSSSLFTSSSAAFWSSEKMRIDLVDEDDGGLALDVLPGAMDLVHALEQRADPAENRARALANPVDPDFDAVGCDVQQP
jgi:hypothetical protein